MLFTVLLHFLLGGLKEYCIYGFAFTVFKEDFFFFKAEKLFYIALDNVRKQSGLIGNYGIELTKI